LVRENINATNVFGTHSAIILAFEQGHYGIVRLLLQHGAVLPEYLQNEVNEGPQLNQNQSVHEVHVSVSRSAKNLLNYYKPDAQFIKTNLADMKQSLDNDFNHPENLDGYNPEWLEPAKKCFDRLSKLDFEDQRSGVTMQQALALVWAGINNADEFEKIAKPEHIERLDRRITLIKNLYEIQRGYNLQGDGANPIDNKKSDKVTCVSASFNKLIAALASVGHTGVEIIFVNKELISVNAQRLTKEAFSSLSEEQKAHFALNWEGEQSDDIQSEYFNLIKTTVEQKLHAEYDEFSEEIHEGADNAINEAMESIEYVDMSDIMKAYKPIVVLPTPAPEPVLFMDAQQRRQLFAAAAEKRLLQEQEDSAAKRQKIDTEQAPIAAETQIVEMTDVEAEEDTLVQPAKRMKR
jgi:hypothetical protein